LRLISCLASRLVSRNAFPFHSSVSITIYHSYSTHVAGTTCGATYGVSANCKLCAVKVLSNAGSGTNDGVIAGIDYVANICSSTPGMKCVANMSLGGGYSPSLNQAVANAVNKGVVMVVAAGNESQDACFVSPASEPLAITVGSTTSTDDQSSFSNWGSCVDVYAPGSGITSSWSTSTTATNTISGTSMASPRKFSSVVVC
jgi:subtilisin family serine protease